MSDLIPVRESKEFKAAVERLNAIPDQNQREHAQQRFGKLCDFLTSEELFGQLPEEDRVGGYAAAVPQDSVFLLNWITVFPSRPVPAPGVEREEVREQLWDTVEVQLGYSRAPE